MRWIALIAAALAVAAFAGGTAFGGPSAKPTLRLMKLHPLTVHGQRFHARELVRVQVQAPSAATRRVRANQSGSFTASFGTGVSRCDVIRVVAIGGEGSRAVLKYLPAPACMPA
jgi:hypothetical protein